MLVPVDLARLLETQQIRTLKRALEYLREQAKYLQDHVRDGTRGDNTGKKTSVPNPSADVEMGTNSLQELQNTYQYPEEEETDVYAFLKGGKGKGKGKGKFSGQCWNCGRVGHRSAEC